MSLDPISTTAGDLSPFDLGAATIHDGPLDPQGRILYTHEQDGSRTVVGIFACRPGQLTNVVRATETIYVLEGDVRIEIESGQTVELGAGDTAVIPAGHTATWTFKSPFREVFVLST